MCLIEEEEEVVGTHSAPHTHDAAAVTANGAPLAHSDFKAKSNGSEVRNKSGQEAAGAAAGRHEPAERSEIEDGKGDKGAVASQRGGALIPQVTSDHTVGDRRRVEMFVTVAAAAMIIGKKGTMLKLLQSKSNATITIDQMQQDDGTKRVCIEGIARAVAVAFKSIQDMVSVCDDSKYEEVARQRQSEGMTKKQEEEAEVRRQKAAKVAAEQERLTATRKLAEDEARRIADERKWLEKKEKATREAEAKRQLQSKIAANPFAFLNDEDKGASSSEEEQAGEKEKGEKKKKKRGKRGVGGAGDSQSPDSETHRHSSASQASRGGEDVGGRAGGEEDMYLRMRRQSNVSMRSLKSDEDEDDESPLDLIGLDKLMRMQNELQPEEMNSSFTSSRKAASNAPEVLDIY